MLAQGLVAPVREDCGERFIILCVENHYDHQHLGLRIDFDNWRLSETNVI
jgi:hypothetical protein